MLDTPFQKMVRAYRREKKTLEALGYRQHETDWEIHRGGRERERIVDVKIGVDGKHIYTLLSGSKTPLDGGPQSVANSGIR